MVGGSLGMALRDVLGGPMPQPIPQQAPMTPYKPSRGQLIAGILGDALQGAMGRPGSFAQQMGQRRQVEQEQAQWGLRRAGDLEDYEKKQQIEQRYRQPDVSPMVRDAQAWTGMTPDQRTAYGQMKQAGAGDPDVFITLPNGQVYAGPKSGLAGAMMGGAPPPAATAPLRPKGKLTPITGGPTSQASGIFRP